jgi:hypothetical protein
MAAKTTRRLQSHNIEAKGRYLLRLDKYCSCHKIYQRFATLSDTETLVWDDVEKLDHDITCGMLHAEKLCLHLGKDSWSPVLKQARMQVEIFKLLLSTARTKRDYSNRITKLIGQYEDELVLPETTEDQIPTIQVSLRRAQRELRAVVKEATHARQEFLLRNQTSATISSNPTEALKWRNIMKAEKSKECTAN